MENKKKKITVLIIILLILVFGLTGYLVYDKVLSSNNENESELETNENSQSNKEMITFMKYEINQNGFNKMLKVNNVEKNILVKEDSLYVDNQKLIDELFLDTYNLELYIYSDLLLVHLHRSEEEKIMIFDVNNQLIKTIDKDVIKYVTFYDDFRLEDGKLLFNVKNIASTGPRINEKFQLCSCLQCASNNSVEGNKTLIEDNENQFIEAIYQLEYSKQNKEISFTQVEVLETLKQYIDKISGLCIIESKK